MVYHIDCFAYVEESLHPWDKSHLIMVYDLFLYIYKFIYLFIYWLRVGFL